MLAITVHINDDIPLEFTSELHRQANDLSDRLGIFTVDVKNRALEHFRHIRSVSARARLARSGSETDLVVKNDVQSPADLVCLELAKVQRFLHDTLAGECGIAMDEQKHAVLASVILRTIQLGPRAPHRH